MVAYRDPSKPSPHGPLALRGGCIRLGERRELFPGVHVTIDQESTHSWVRLAIEADKSVPITEGFPHQRKQPSQPQPVA